MKITKLALIATATVAAAVALPATAHADGGSFQSPSGNIFCDMGGGNGGVVCEISDRTYVATPPPTCHLAWGGRFDLDQGSAPVMPCHGDTIRPSYSFPGPNPDVPILDYGHTQTAGAITCDSEPTGVTCTDSSTGHFFRVSRDSYQLG